RGRARRARQRTRLRAARDRAAEAAGTGAARPVPLLWVGGAREAGHRARGGLALVVAAGATFIVLAEPTTHLALESREALEAALDAFPGTVLLVSHDRALLDAIAEGAPAVGGGGV